jgi:hypothetical protein
MSEDTTAVETVDTETEVTETPTISITFEGMPVVLEATKPRKKKGSDEETSYFFPKLEGAGVLAFLTKAVGVDKLAAALIRELVKPAASEATNVAKKVDPETGELTFSEADYINAFKDQFNPTSRRSSGENKKDLQLRVQALTPELLEVVSKVTSNPADTDSRNRMQRIMLEIQELNGKIEAKSRGPQAPRKPKKAKTTATT